MISLKSVVFYCRMHATRPWLNWIEQQISNLWVAGSSPAGRATNSKTDTMSVFIFAPRTRTDQSCEATTGSTTSRFGKHSAAKSSRLPHRHKVSGESCWARHKLKKTKFDLLFFCPIIHRTINTKKKQKAQL